MSLTERETEQVNPTNQPSPRKKGGQRWPGWTWLKNLDRGIVALLIVFVLTLPLFTPRVYASDEIKYFSYLHSIFFDRDLDFFNEYTYFYNSNPKVYADFKQSVIEKLNERNVPVNEGPVGSALLWSPFYGLAHLVALGGNAAGLKSFQPDGFSTPYIWSVTLASLLYGFAGLVFAYLFVRNFVPRFYAALATIAVWLASPVVFYMSITPPMSHANSLFVISVWLWLWYRTRGWSIDDEGRFVPGWRRGSMWLLLGVLGGLIAMVREQDGVILIIAALEVLYLGWTAYRSRRAGSEDRSPAPEFLRLAGGSLLLLAGLGLAVLPQLIVYVGLNGRIGPGKTVGDKLQFFNPEVPWRMVQLLFNPDHGLFWWSPVLLAALAGLGLALRDKRLRLVAVVLLAAFVGELYISAAFQTWTMRGSFAPRRLVGISPLYIFGLAYLLYRLAEHRRPGRLRLSRRALVLVSAFLIAWNFGLIIQFSTIRTTQSRLSLDPARVVADQFTVVPGKLVDTARKFLFERDRLYKS